MIGIEIKPGDILIDDSTKTIVHVIAIEYDRTGMFLHPPVNGRKMFYKFSTYSLKTKRHLTSFRHSNLHHNNKWKLVQCHRNRVKVY